ncbi:MAG: hypothetical protein HFJ28_00215 [Clostridia bacterium]|jgi:hypothetical protein|nr:hypothetical protein [Clostridia bacterium]
MEEKIFGVPMKEVRRQLDCSAEIPRFSFFPPLIGGDDALEFCISSSKDILGNPEKKEFFHRLYHGL